jgi:hypothetical protein
MSTFRSLLAAGALTLFGAMSALVTPSHAALQPNAINLNAINLNAVNLNSLRQNSATGNSLTSDDAWLLSARGVTLPSGRSFELPR